MPTDSSGASVINGSYTKFKEDVMRCSLSPILFSVFINDILKEVDNAGNGVS